jgi:FkbM family methyltransferase
LRYLLFTSSSSLLRHLPYYSSKYQDLWALIALASPGGVCVDVGANIGFYAQRLAKAVGPAGRVFAFEPVSDCFSALVRGIPIELRHSIVAEKLIVSDESGMLSITLPIASGVALPGLSHVNDPGAIVEGKSESVNAVTLDEYFALKDTNIDLIKIDVEGYELHVLKGARKLLESKHPHVLCEIHDSPSLVDTLEYMSALGYIAHYCCQTKLIPIDKAKDGWRKHLDYFFLREDISKTVSGKFV